MRNPRTLRIVFSLSITVALLVANGLTANPMGLLFGIKNAEAQEWPIPKSEGSRCLAIQGKFRNVGEYVLSSNRGSRFLPRLSSDILSSGWPGRNIVQVQIETLGNTILRFWFVEQSGQISGAQEFKSVCQNGWWVFSKSVSGGAEGWHGTQTTFIQLAIANDGSLLAHVVRNSKGKDFYLVPRESSEEYVYRFLIAG